MLRKLQTSAVALAIVYGHTSIAGAQSGQLRNPRGLAVNP